MSNYLLDRIRVKAKEHLVASTALASVAVGILLPGCEADSSQTESSDPTLAATCIYTPENPNEHDVKPGETLTGIVKRKVSLETDATENRDDIVALIAEEVYDHQDEINQGTRDYSLPIPRVAILDAPGVTKGDTYYLPNNCISSKALSNNEE